MAVTVSRVRLCSVKLWYGSLGELSWVPLVQGLLRWAKTWQFRQVEFSHVLMRYGLIWQLRRCMVRLRGFCQVKV